MQYVIYMHSQSVGTANVEKDGLYFSFSCSCQIQLEGIYKVAVREGDHLENLGVLIPEGNMYVLTAKVPRKRFHTDNFSFEVMDAKRKASGTSIPLASDKPFLHISKLRKSYLEIADGQMYIRLPGESSQRFSSSPTGQ